VLLTSDFFGAFFDFLTFLVFFVVSDFFAGVGVGLDVTSAANTLHDKVKTRATANAIILLMVVTSVLMDFVHELASLVLSRQLHLFSILYISSALPTLDGNTSSCF